MHISVKTDFFQIIHFIEEDPLKNKQKIIEENISRFQIV